MCLDSRKYCKETGEAFYKDVKIAEGLKKPEDYAILQEQLKKEAKSKYKNLPENEALTKYLDEVIESEKLKLAKEKRLKEIFEEKKKGKWKDPGHNKNRDFSEHELETFVEIELIYDVKVRPAPLNSNADVIAVSGELKGKTFDPAGLPNKEGAIKQWNYRYISSLNRFKDSVATHFNKLNKKPALDVFILDLRNVDKFPPQTKKDILDYLEKNYSSYLNNNDKFKILF